MHTIYFKGRNWTECVAGLASGSFYFAIFRYEEQLRLHAAQISSHDGWPWASWNIHIRKYCEWRAHCSTDQMTHGNCHGFWFVFVLSSARFWTATKAANAIKSELFQFAFGIASRETLRCCLLVLIVDFKTLIYDNEIKAWIRAHSHFRFPIRNDMIE